MTTVNRIAAVALTATLFAGCTTITNSTKSEPVAENVVETGRRYEATTPAIWLKPRVPTTLMITAVRTEKCFVTRETTMRATVTDDIRVEPVQRSAAFNAAGAAAALAALGVGTGAVTSLFTVYDPRQTDASGRLVPIASQPGFALWPVGAAVAGAAVVVALPVAVVPPVAVLMSEETVQHDEREVVSAEVEEPACARDVPVEGAVTLTTRVGPQHLGALDQGTLPLDVSAMDANLAADPETGVTLVVGDVGVAFTVRVSGDDVVFVNDKGETAAVLPLTSMTATSTRVASLRKAQADVEARRAAEQRQAEERRAADEETARRADDQRRAAKKAEIEKARSDYLARARALALPTEADVRAAGFRKRNEDRHLDGTRTVAYFMDGPMVSFFALEIAEDGTTVGFMLEAAANNFKSERDFLMPFVPLKDTTAGKDLLGRYINGMGQCVEEKFKPVTTMDCTSTCKKRQGYVRLMCATQGYFVEGVLE